MLVDMSAQVAGEWCKEEKESIQNSKLQAPRDFSLRECHCRLEFLCFSCVRVFASCSLPTLLLTAGCCWLCFSDIVAMVVIVTICICFTSLLPYPIAILGMIHLGEKHCNMTRFVACFNDSLKQNLFQSCETTRQHIRGSIGCYMS